MIRHSASARVANADAGVARGASVLKRRYIVDRFFVLVCCGVWCGRVGLLCCAVLCCAACCLPSHNQ